MENEPEDVHVRVAELLELLSKLNQQALGFDEFIRARDLRAVAEAVGAAQKYVAGISRLRLSAHDRRLGELMKDCVSQIHTAANSLDLMGIVNIAEGVRQVEGYLAAVKAWTVALVNGVEEHHMWVYALMGNLSDTAPVRERCRDPRACHEWSDCWELHDEDLLRLRATNAMLRLFPKAACTIELESQKQLLEQRITALGNWARHYGKVRNHNEGQQDDSALPAAMRHTKYDAVQLFTRSGVVDLTDETTYIEGNNTPDGLLLCSIMACACMKDI